MQLILKKQYKHKHQVSPSQLPWQCHQYILPGCSCNFKMLTRTSLWRCCIAGFCNCCTKCWDVISPCCSPKKQTPSIVLTLQSLRAVRILSTSKTPKMSFLLPKTTTTVLDNLFMINQAFRGTMNRKAYTKFKKKRKKEL